MNAIAHIAHASARLGYRQEAIVFDYGFNDFGAEPAVARRAALAVFTQSPVSYRSAAFGVLKVDAIDQAEREVQAHRALGAPLFFVEEANSVSVWQAYAHGPARLLHRTFEAEIDSLFTAHQDEWSPEAIHRAKTIGRIEPAYQLDFVDLGLLPAIEGQIHRKLDRLLADTLAVMPRRGPWSDGLLFQAVFRLLAAKILIDRGHPSASTWDQVQVGSVIAGIGQYYGLASPQPLTQAGLARDLAPAWEVLRQGVNVSNISADDLAYVYENTLVTPETRRSFGTHSTPRQVAEFIAVRLRLWDASSRGLRVVEPFTGAGVLLVAAVRHLREALPRDWTDRQRHNHLVTHVRGSEIDAFAKEVATLSLILADYPNTNGWKIDQADLFEPGSLHGALQGASVILCNPPFEPLTMAERIAYPQLAAEGGTKAEAVLRQAIQAAPQALGFVLPQSFLLDRAYAWHRREIERRFADVDVVSLPDGIFEQSSVESALLIARTPAALGTRQRLRTSAVADADRRRFLTMGVPTTSREEERALVAEPSGQLWLPPLNDLWRRLSHLPTLGQLCEAHWGIRWHDGGQGRAAHARPGPGRKLGLMKSHDHRQFVLGAAQWVDVRPDRLYGAGELPWDRPKVLCNAGRNSRGKWRIAAAVDRNGWVASQQFACLWPTVADVDLDALAALINSPLGNAFITDHTTDRRLRIGTLLALPLPPVLPPGLGALAREYAQVAGSTALFQQRALSDLLDRIDDMVLEAYDLPPRKVRSLLSEFRGAVRPVAHAWDDWNVSADSPALTIRELRSDWIGASHGNWPSRELAPVSQPEMDAYLQAVG